MIPPSIQGRLTSVSSTYKQTIPLIHRLHSFTAAVGQGDEARVELSGEIHHRLKEMEEEMEILRLEIEPLESNANNRHRESDAKESEKERAVSMMRKLDEDVKSARAQFRKAQLQAKRNAETAKRKERQLLFAGITGEEVARRKASPKLTQDELVANASNDVTAALKQTHQLMQTELSRSRFAQETLEQSTAALGSLSESYTNLDTLLSSSRTLVSSLLRSQKSDTWYLETALYILVGTITWLLFRRIFYGPLWWLLWLPLKMMYRLTFAFLGAVGLSSGVSQSTSVGSVAPGGTTGSVAGAQDTPPQVQYTASAPPSGDDSTQTTEEGVRQEIEDMSGEGQPEQDPRKGTNVDDISPEERQRQEAMPRNPKKRMWEEKVDEKKKDEL